MGSESYESEMASQLRVSRYPIGEAESVCQVLVVIDSQLQEVDCLVPGKGIHTNDRLL